MVFDLDDTLIDTSGTVTPFQLQRIAQILRQTGVVDLDSATIYQELLTLSFQRESTQRALREWMAARAISEEVERKIFSYLTAPLPPSFPIPTLPFANEILDYFRKRCPLVLVTGGDSSFQREKLEKSSLDSSLFSKIHIASDCVKTFYYQKIMQEFQVPSEQIWVCGDRVKNDLEPAARLGWNTVHMRWGPRNREGLQSPSVQHSIIHLAQLKEIIV